ncbi:MULTISPECIES: tRNA pseudouridine synthase A [unclassified Arthrobacter]|uniref:tRNA pseudouridine synthase A n=1 Tax=unclassified Arthrobacter TaxID=235627 RepID=UPI001D155FEE|nr:MULTISPECIES: tRNA pseudouridine synthase A [unclassified Arthrobacter]MCC3276112.1 tRNA pseudouridine synthase A [Arthrobacter sp. zg-Y20]MCC9176302.1 tRNA pseudouridine synthase A [Arthrobacter sp. zg-Y750]MDK1316272.1 tRNA pseudouridine synthase A [Arthrobacter sp. zg.Y20]MDK1326999.1 tRNA pseudouridine synthase A [Arthrobacter sp. zg-Y1143]WIB05449.1 tRNA pseudouridine synthase A [Arthrobacter sp. zg-Y20]
MTLERPALPEPDGGPFRVRMDLAYDGAPFSGWAAQPGLWTVQGLVEDALAVLLRRPVRITVAGRTDAGVHARGQVVHFDLTAAEWYGLARGRDLDPGVSLRRRLHGVLNKELTMAAREAGQQRRAIDAHGGAVEVLSAVPAPAGFDARFSALWRRYSYRICDLPENRDPLSRHTTLWFKAPLDIGLMNQAADGVLGIRDFLSFCKPRTGSTTIRELQEFSFSRGADGVITTHIQADAFCHNMVRSLVGGSLLVGSGERRPQWLADRLAARIRDSKSLLAPPHPLVLEEVRYPADAELAGRAELTRAHRE